KSELFAARGLHPRRLSVFCEKLSNLRGCSVSFPMRMSSEMTDLNLFAICGWRTLRGFLFKQAHNTSAGGSAPGFVYAGGKNHETSSCSRPGAGTLPVPGHRH